MVAAAMDLRHLRYFVAVAEEQNITRAAARLHVSQPPLSRQIRDLEEELGVDLFRRTPRSIALTGPGRLFLGEASAVLQRAEEAVRTVRVAAKRERRELRLGYAPSLTVEMLPRALKLFEQTAPDVRVSLHDLSTGECAERLQSNKLDLALIVRPSASRGRGLVFEKLVEYPLYAAVSTLHPLARKRALPIARLAKERLVAYSREDYPEYLILLRDLFRPYGFEPDPSEECDSATSLIAAVEAGRGIALVPSSMRCLAGPRLKLLALTPTPPPVSLGALSRRPPSALISGFIAAARKAAAMSVFK
jgi:DNA-binding transcriptional LysR family regulator